MRNTRALRHMYFVLKTVKNNNKNNNSNYIILI